MEKRYQAAKTISEIDHIPLCKSVGLNKTIKITNVFYKFRNISTNKKK